jgi:hypothetical protein
LLKIQVGGIIFLKIRKENEMSKKTFKPFDEFIKETGWSFTVFAKKLGVSYDTVYAWRVHPEELTLSKIKKIAEVTNKSFKEVNALFSEFYL